MTIPLSGVLMDFVLLQKNNLPALKQSAHFNIETILMWIPQRNWKPQKKQISKALGGDNGNCNDTENDTDWCCPWYWHRTRPDMWLLISYLLAVILWHRIMTINIYRKNMFFWFVKSVYILSPKLLVKVWNIWPKWIGGWYHIRLSYLESHQSHKSCVTFVSITSLPR